MKQNLLIDLKHIKNALIKVYPSAFRKLTSNWIITVSWLIAIICAFYLDEAVSVLVTGIHISAIDTIFSFGRWYGSGQPTLYLFAVLYIAGFLFQKYKLRETGLLIGEAYVFSGILTLIFKSAVGRMRPYTGKGDLFFEGWSWTNNDQFSYYSGHAAVAFALSAILASTTDNKYLKAFYYAIAAVTCISRIYHQQHWFSDVLTGALVAYLISSVLVEIHREPVSGH